MPSNTLEEIECGLGWKSNSRLSGARVFQPSSFGEEVASGDFDKVGTARGWTGAAETAEQNRFECNVSGGWYV